MNLSHGDQRYGMSLEKMTLAHLVLVDIWLYTVSQKNQDTELLAITSPNIILFSNLTNSCLNFSPRFKHVATLPCEI